ncbi:MAG: pyridoxal phosphate-dependent aminotransferase [Firmicutes bacterium]|nr:pyridoxal phosphate-dependent aminotransferase [Bacillota bacterium]
MNLSKKAIQTNPSPTLSIDAKFKEMIASGIDVIGFGAGEPDFDTPEHIKDAAIAAIKAGQTKYTPASGTNELKKAICEKLQKDNCLSYNISDIVVSNGAKHSLANAFSAILNPGDEVIIPAPFWVSYPELVKLADGVPVALHTDESTNFKFSPQQLAAAITPKTKALIVNSPSNPTGMVYSKAELAEIAKIVVDNDLFAVSDEIYEKLIYEGEHYSIASFGEDIKAKTIVVNGVSKSYAMTGWRIGYTASNPQIAKVMANIQSHLASNPSSISQAAAVAALSGSQNSVSSMRDEFALRRDYIVKAINAIPGASCLTPQGAFYVMMNIKSFLGGQIKGKVINNSDEFCAHALEVAKVALVPGSGFEAEGYVRWSYATDLGKIKEGIKRITNFLS